MKRQFSYWMFTFNNPTVLTPEAWKHKPLYVVWQLEKGAQGTEHYQGYAVWDKKVNLSGAKKCLPKAHWDRRNGTHDQAKHYVTKPVEDCECRHCTGESERLDGPWTYGDDSDVPLKKGQRSDLINVKRKIDEGTSMKELFEDEETLPTMIRHHRAFKVYKRFKSTKRNWETEIITLIGETGTGKTAWARQNYPDLYSCPHAKGSGTYWDDYDEHEVVLVDEMYGNRFSMGFLLGLTDRYPFTVPVHGGSVNFCPKIIIFTSNAQPDDWYTSVDSITQERKLPYFGGPLERRLTQNGSRVYRMDMGGVMTIIEGEAPRGIYPLNKE